MKRPWWITLIVVALVAASIALPLMLGAQMETNAAAPAFAGLGEMSLLLKLYPAYTFAAGLCAWLCWPRRKEITWILLAVLLLSSIGLCLIL